MKTLTILVVDDDDAMRNTIVAILERFLKVADHSVLAIEASSVSTAKNLLLKITPDLIITDLVMPGGDGFQLVLHVRTETDCKSVPILMSSGNENLIKEHAQAAQLAGMLPKPFRSSELVEAVKKILNLP